jgi:alkaline phosphatase
MMNRTLMGGTATLLDGASSMMRGLLSSTRKAVWGVRAAGTALLCMAALSLVPGSAGASSGTDAPARSLILFIGDGMGVQIMSIAALYAKTEMAAELNMIKLANQGATGLVSTHSADRLVTDSAASGTAIATGVMTNNGVVGMAPDGGVLQNLFEVALWEGKAVGVVTTTSVTDATPACFMAHVPYRGEHEEIAGQIVEGSVDVVMGGGRMYFQPPPQRPDRDRQAAGFPGGLHCRRA